MIEDPAENLPYALEVQAPGSQRLDRWLADQRPDLSRSRIQKLIEQGQVRLNGVLCREKNHPLHAGDRLELEIPPIQPSRIEPETIPLDILFEDDVVMVINKPRDLVVHPAAGHASGTLVNALLAHCSDLSGINGEQRPGIVHRLDKDTTGALVIAKTDQAHHHLQAQIQAKSARREYLGVVFGRPELQQGSIDAPVGRHPIDRKKMAVVDPQRGRSAVTHWRVVEALGNYTLMHFELATGRTHQIRVHAAYRHWPIVGDPLYTSSKTSPVNLTGQALHAWKLTFTHPTTGETICCTAPLPEEFQRLLQRLRQISRHGCLS